MFQAIRKHISPTTALAFMALVFAMTGGAFAASSNGGGGSGAKASASAARAGLDTTLASASKAKPKAKAGPRGPAGPKGAAGAPGPAGATGPAGPAGPAGAGTPGANGTNGTNGAPGEKGAEGKEGKEGKSGFTSTLPSEKTEQGTWSFTVPPHNPTAGISVALASISFVIPLATAPTAHVLEPGKGETAECPGTASNPQASPGQLCVYIEEAVNVAVTPGNIGVEPHAFGASVFAPNGDEPGGIAFGSWAVTAE
jgi:hypothetical protein